MDIAIMVEGQDGLTWPRWQGIVQAGERLRLAGLYRSDHFTNAGPPGKQALELWTPLTWLAADPRRRERYAAHAAPGGAVCDGVECYLPDPGEFRSPQPALG